MIASESSLQLSAWWLLFMQAALIGLSIAAPVGPVGLLCIQRTLIHGRHIGLASGLGAALADACYGALGAVGAQSLIHFLLAWADGLALAGAAFLGWMALGLWRGPISSPVARPQGQAAPAQVVAPPSLGAGAAFASVFGLTLANPMTVLSFTAVFTSLAAGSALRWQGQAAMLVMVGGVFAGSALWWLMLALGVGALRQYLGAVMMRRINQASALLLTAVAVWQLVQVLGRLASR